MEDASSTTVRAAKGEGSGKEDETAWHPQKLAKRGAGRGRHPACVPGRGESQGIFTVSVSACFCRMICNLNSSPRS